MEGRDDGDGLAVEGCDAVLDECVAGVGRVPSRPRPSLLAGARVSEFENCAHAGKHKERHTGQSWQVFLWPGRSVWPDRG